MEDLAIKVRKLREVYGYSQESVAYQMGISQAAYSKKERGITRFTFACVETLAKVYQLSFMELVSLSTQTLLVRAIEANKFNAAA
jgi:transcriptional regulator with XRE-family HTH domain